MNDSPLLAWHADTRRKARRINPYHTISLALLKHYNPDRLMPITVEVEHGGGVPNSYDYPATSQCVGVVIGADGRGIVGYAAINANKITLAGVADATVNARELFDERIGEEKTRACVERLIITMQAHHNLVHTRTLSGAICYLVRGEEWRVASTQQPTAEEMQALQVMQEFDK
jgi:hypothetical protein